MTFKYDLALLKSRKGLLDFLGLDEDAFEGVLAFDPIFAQTPHCAEDAIRFSHIPLFFHHKIPKRNSKRGYRIVWEPTTLKNNYKALARQLNNFFCTGLMDFRIHGYLDM